MSNPVQSEQGGSAFPRGVGDRGGMTLRDYFAAHAPVEIPQWFQITDFPPLPAEPAVPEGLSERGAKLARDWRNDPIFELSNYAADNELPASDEPLLAAYASAMEAWWDAKEEHGRDKEAARFFSWRWHYAAMMVRGVVR